MVVGRTIFRGVRVKMLLLCFHFGPHTRAIPLDVLDHDFLRLRLQASNRHVRRWEI